VTATNDDNNNNWRYPSLHVWRHGFNNYDTILVKLLSKLVIALYEHTYDCEQTYRPSYRRDLKVVTNKLLKYYDCNSVCRTAYFQCSLLLAISSRPLHSDVWWTTCVEKPSYLQPPPGKFSSISVSPITLIWKETVNSYLHQTKWCEEKTSYYWYPLFASQPEHHLSWLGLFTVLFISSRWMLRQLFAVSLNYYFRFTEYIRAVSSVVNSFRNLKNILQ
jgi:hypothetical protein